MPKYKLNIDSVLDANSSKNFVARIIHPEGQPHINNPDGTYSTHKLGYADNFVFPMIIQNKDKSLTEFKDWRKAYDYAKQNNEGIELKTEEEAEYFTKNYKTSKYGIPTKYRNGKSGEDFTFAPSQYQSKTLNTIPEQNVQFGKQSVQKGISTINSAFNYNPSKNPDDPKYRMSVETAQVPKFRNGKSEERDILAEIDEYINYKKENKSFKEYMKQYGINR